MKTLSILRWMLALAVVALLLPPPAPAAAQGATWVIEVNDTQDKADFVNNDVCDINYPDLFAECTLRAAIDEANLFSNPDYDDVYIHVPAGTYTLTLPGVNENGNDTGDLDLRPQNKDIVIEGDSPLTTIIDANSLDRVFDIGFYSGSATHYAVTLRNLTITGGNLFGQLDGTLSLCGAGIFNEGALRLENVIIEDNHTDFTGALSTGPDGGGIFNGVPGSLLINSTIIRNNSAVRGGGIFSNTTLTMLGSTVSGNSAVSQATESTSSGAILNYGTALISNSTISGNNSTSTIGGIGAYSPGTLSMENVTLVKNQSLYSPANLWAMSTVNIRNSIIAYPQGDFAYNCDGAASIISTGYNVSDDDTCHLVASGDLNNVDPLLSPLARLGNTIPPYAPTHGLLSGSPAKDHRPGLCQSFDGGTVTIDQRGENRGDGKCDTGAFEGLAWVVFLPATLR